MTEEETADLRSIGIEVGLYWKLPGQYGFADVNDFVFVHYVIKE